MIFELPSLSPELAALIGTGMGFGISVAIFSYIFSDNPLYRLALHIYIGAAVGYAALVTIYQVLVPRLVEPLASGQLNIVSLSSVPLVLFIFLSFKLNPRLSPWGNIAIAVMLGVGLAVSLAGALRGTLLPQIQATWLALGPGFSLSLLDNLVMVVGTLTTLLYFQFWVRARTAEGRPGVLRSVVNGVGRVFVVVTMGATYAGMILSGIALFSERVEFLWDFISRILG